MCTPVLLRCRTHASKQPRMHDKNKGVGRGEEMLAIYVAIPVGSEAVGLWSKVNPAW